MSRRHDYRQDEGGEILPPGYVRLSYIQGDGINYIDLGIAGGYKVYVKIDCSTHQTTGGTIFGYYNTNSPYNKCYMGFGEYLNLGYGNGYNTGYSQSYTINQEQRYAMEFQTCSGDSWLKRDGVTLFSTTEMATYSNNLNFYLLGRNNGGSAGAFTKARVYGDLYIYVDDVLKCHCIPALRISDNKTGLWDFKRKMFLTNSGNDILPSGGGIPTGLRFYVPLSSTSDIIDRVSGASPITGTAQISWDNTEGAFHVITTAPEQLAWIYNIPNINTYAEPYQYTAAAKVKINSFTGTVNIITVGKTGNEETSSAFLETHRHTGITADSWHTIAMTLNNSSDLTFYLNGSVVRTSTTPSNYTACYPGNWLTDDKQNNITICGGFANSGNYHYDTYIKDVMVFERCLTQTEIQQL